MSKEWKGKEENESTFLNLLEGTRRRKIKKNTKWHREENYFIPAKKKKEKRTKIKNITQKRRLFTTDLKVGQLKILALFWNNTLPFLAIFWDFWPEID